MYNINKVKSKSQTSRNVMGGSSLLLIAAVMMVYSGLYSFVAIDFLAPYHLEKYVPILFYTLTAIVIFIMTIYRAKSVLFDSSDNDMLFTLPIPVKTILASRLITLLLINYAFAALIFLPSLVVYGIHAQVGLIFYLIGVIEFMVLPCIPTVLAGVVGYVIAYFSSKTNRKKVVEIIATFGVCIGILVFFSMIQTIGMQFVTHIDKIEKIMQTYGFVIQQMQLALFETNLLSLAILIGINILVFLVFVWALSGNYQNIINRLKIGKVRKQNKKTTYTSHRIATTLIKKEWNHYVSTPVYIVNTAFGVILLVIMTVYAIFANTDQLLQMIAQEGVEIPIFLLLAVIVSFIISISNVSASSISLEGKNLWILKSMPVSISQIFRSKVVFHMIITVPIPMICTAILGGILHLPIAKIILLLLYEIVLGLVVGQFGLMINLRHPKLTYTSESQVVKQSVSSFISVMVPILFTMIGATVAMSVSNVVSMELVIFILMSVFLVVAWIQHHILQHSGKVAFENLS